MQISKSFLVVCAAAYCAGLLPLRAADTDAQIKAREALQQRLNELQGQPPAATPPPSVAAPQPTPQVVPAPVPVPAAIAAPAAPVAQPQATLAAPPPADPESIARARAALEQKMKELQPESAQAVPAPAAQPAPLAAQPAPTAAPVAQPVTVVVPAAPAAPVAQPMTVVVPAAPAAPAAALAVPPPVDSDSIAKAREALRQKMAEMGGQPAPAMPQPVVATPAPVPSIAPVPTVPPTAQPAPAPVVQATAVPAIQPVTGPVLVAPTPADPEEIAKARAALEQKMKEVPPPAPVSAQKPTVPALEAFPPIQGPPAAISADKQQRLEGLLSRYKADQVTPEEYHQQRAKILAEP